MMITSPPTELNLRRFETNGGASIFQIPLQLFPTLAGYAYLVIFDDPYLGRLRVLIDTGSGFGSSNQNLEKGLQAISNLGGEPITLDKLTHILITHGHIDHFGGLSYVRSRTPAMIGVHELDLRNLTHYEERIAVVARRLNEFLTEAGVSEEQRFQMIELYKSTKSLYHSVRVDFTYEAIRMQLGPFEMLHVPGHCAGHVAIRLHNILFSGDHVLSQTSPHQSPERLTLSTGLDHYLRSLDILQAWAGDIPLTLGGHKDPITNLPERIGEIRKLHSERLRRVLELFSVPRTIAQVSQQLFGEPEGYTALLAIEEAGAHVEYLYQRGMLGIQNLAEIDQSDHSTSIHYQQSSVPNFNSFI